MSAEDFSVKLVDNRLTISADSVPLRAIFLKLAEQGIIVKIDPDINPNVTAHFSEHPMEQGLASIVKPVSYSLVWNKVSDQTQHDYFAVAEIHVFRAGKEGRIRPLLRPDSRTIVKSEDGILHIAGEILLRLKPGTDIGKLKEMLEKRGARLVFNEKLPGFVKIVYPNDADVFALVAEIKDRLNTDSVEPNYVFRRQMPVHYANAPPEERQEQLFGARITEDSPSVAILDSGLSERPELDSIVRAFLNTIDEEALMNDSLGHGTQMALIASGVIEPFGTAERNEPLIPIIPIKIFDDSGFVSSQSILESIAFALQNDARVMSLSWGTEVQSEFLEEAFASADSKGLIIVASAGNQPTGRDVYPAAYSSVIGVGALQPDGEQWSQSNYGDFVKLYAPGFANMPVGYEGEPGLYGGTSISAAFVANSIAGYIKEHPDATRGEINTYLENRYSAKQ
jgi:hypothetical protein